MAVMFDHPPGGRVYGRGGQIHLGVLAPFEPDAATPGNGTKIALRGDSAG